jgi:hypothetical protein
MKKLYTFLIITCVALTGNSLKAEPLNSGALDQLLKSYSASRLTLLAVSLRTLKDTLQVVRQIKPTDPRIQSLEQMIREKEIMDR